MKLRASFALLAGLSLAAAGSAAPLTGGSPAPKILDRDVQGVPTFVTGALGSLPKGDRGRAAVAFLKSFALRNLQARGSEDFAADRVRVDALGKLHVRVQQRLGGLSVVGAELILHAEAATGEVYAVNGRFVPDPGLPAKPALTAAKALASAYLEAGIQSPEVLAGPVLTYVIDSAGIPRLAWSAVVRYQAGEEEMADRIFADAHLGGIAARHPLTYDARNRETYTAGTGTTLPGTFLIGESDTSTDTYVQKVHDNTGVVYNYYFNRFGRDSVDNAGMTLVSTIHYAYRYNNAKWDPTREQMIYGDGDGSQFSPLGSSLDVVGHELTHGVTQHESGLVYQDESGAVNESLSDIFAAAIQASTSGVVDASTWKIGEDVYTPATAGDALRYMDYPTRDGASKDYYPERYIGGDDYGGVHWNSGIPNLAFQRLVVGGYHPRGKNHYAVPALGMAKAEAIFYRAQTEILTSLSDIPALRNATLQAASDLYGASERAAVRMAWCMVGVFGGDCPFNLDGSGTTFAGRRLADLYWINGSGASVDLFRNGVKVTTASNSGYVRDMFSSTATSANYWVCTAGSTTYYNSATCSNVTTVYF